MKRVYLVVAACLLTMLGLGSGFAGSRISFEDLVLRNEQNPKLGLEAKQLADRLGLPRAIVFTRGVVIDAMGIEDGRPVYAVMSNLAHPFQGAEVLTYDEIVRRYDVSKGIVNPTGPVIPDGGRVATKTQSSVLLVPDWTADKVMAFDPQNGDLLDSAFIPSNSVALASPKEARVSPWMRITVSDQITDLVQAFDTSGAREIPQSRSLP
ncbi:MAG: hypothetical protein HY961_04635 [Ignavibacteriae bacterium]|nr:hypothetical protein [Ignavibacteriota bacterium]